MYSGADFSAGSDPESDKKTFPLVILVPLFLAKVEKYDFFKYFDFYNTMNIYSPFFKHQETMIHGYMHMNEILNRERHKNML